MGLKFDGSKQELESPYCLENERFCKLIESFVIQRGGKAKGMFNAWSYAVEGRFGDKVKWYIRYDKSTFTSGNLFLKSKLQSLFFRSRWKAYIDCNLDEEIIIKKNSFWTGLNPNFKAVMVDANKTGYVAKNGRQKDTVYDLVLSCLKEQFQKREIFLIKITSRELMVELRSEKNNLETLKNLMQTVKW